MRYLISFVLASFLIMPTMGYSAIVDNLSANIVTRTGTSSSNGLSISGDITRDRVLLSTEVTSWDGGRGISYDINGTYDFNKNITGIVGDSAPASVGDAKVAGFAGIRRDPLSNIERRIHAGVFATKPLASETPDTTKDIGVSLFFDSDMNRAKRRYCYRNGSSCSYRYSNHTDNTFRTGAFFVLAKELNEITTANLVLEGNTDIFEINDVRANAKGVLSHEISESLNVLLSARVDWDNSRPYNNNKTETYTSLGVEHVW